MRYFKTTNALRPYRTKEGRGFEFEQLRLIGGLFHGVLALEPGDMADVVAAYGRPVSEIKESEYYALKKKAQPTSPSFGNSEKQPQVPPQKVVASVASPDPEPVQEPESPDELFKTGEIEITDHLDSATK